MISVTHTNLIKYSNDHQSLVLKCFDLKETGTTQKHKDEFKRWFDSKIFKRYSFENLLSADTLMLEEIADYYEAVREDEDVDKCKWLLNLYKDFSSGGSKRLDGYSASKLLAGLEISVCPYCNRNYIYNIGNTGKRTSQLDHLYDKHNYPLLAMSFFNLIPSCGNCNNLKRNKKPALSPYDDRYVLQNMYNFSIRVKGAELVNKADDLEVIMNPDEEFVENVNCFALDALYKNHNDIAHEILKKKYIYSEEYIDQLFTQYKDSLFSTRDELVGLILGNYITDDDLHKRPLAKFTQDIWKEVNE